MSTSIAGHLSRVSCFCVLAFLASTSGVRGQEIFFGDFETGSVGLWSDAVGLAERIFRFSDLDLRDPHVFFDASPLGCQDLTDVPFLLLPALNPSLEAAMTMDGDGDGSLDASSLLIFRGGLSLAVQGGFVDAVGGVCSAPVGTTTCQADPLTTRNELRFDAGGAGCLGTVAGTTTGYLPAIAEPGMPCFVTAVDDLTIELGAGGSPLVLSFLQAQISATLAGEPIGSLMTGLLRGFVTEADADQVMLPPELGGGVLSALLPGGTGSCAAGNDLDDLDGTSGWWFYFNFEASEVSFG